MSIALTTLEQYEELWKGYDINGNPGPKRFLIWFSAAWCGPCKAMDKAELIATAKEMTLPFYYCDEVVNRETIDAAGITSFPTFIMFNPGSVVAKRNSADTTKVCQWIKKVGLQ